MQVLLQVVWSEVWLVWDSSPGLLLPSSCVGAKPRLRPRLLMVLLMVKVHPAKLLRTLLPSCNNFLNLLTAKPRTTAPPNTPVAILNRSTTLMTPAPGPKTIGSVHPLFTRQLLLQDNHPITQLSLGITAVFPSCRVFDDDCMWLVDQII